MPAGSRERSYRVGYTGGEGQDVPLELVLDGDGRIRFPNQYAVRWSRMPRSP